MNNKLIFINALGYREVTEIIAKSQSHALSCKAQTDILPISFVGGLGAVIPVVRVLCLGIRQLKRAIERRFLCLTQWRTEPGCPQRCFKHFPAIYQVFDCNSSGQFRVKNTYPFKGLNCDKWRVYRQKSRKFADGGCLFECRITNDCFLGRGQNDELKAQRRKTNVRTLFVRNTLSRRLSNFVLHPSKEIKDYVREMVFMVFPVLDATHLYQIRVKGEGQ
ncbi:hypothetical protein ACFFLG_14760 [Shewanella indica]|uniref:hypothetical protein n=1 Tax=Shewanella indica TaxID=768528 RepID=UPI000C34191C|nr:hypothetical protein [Shewanella indica]